MYAWGFISLLLHISDKWVKSLIAVTKSRFGKLLEKLSSILIEKLSGILIEKTFWYINRKKLSGILIGLNYW